MTRARPLTRRACARKSRVADDATSFRGGRSPWPDLVIIDGGRGQLSAAQETLACARSHRRAARRRSPKGRTATPDARPSSARARAVQAQAARSGALFHRSGCATRRTASRSGSHRARRKPDIREAGLQEIPGIGPTRKRALAAAFRHPESDRARAPRDLAKVRGRQRRNRTQDLRLSSTKAPVEAEPALTPKWNGRARTIRQVEEFGSALLGPQQGRSIVTISWKRSPPEP